MFKKKHKHRNKGKRNKWGCVDIGINTSIPTKKKKGKKTFGLPTIVFTELCESMQLKQGIEII